MKHVKKLTAILLSIAIFAGLLPSAILPSLAASEPGEDAYTFRWVRTEESFPSGTFLIGGHRAEDDFCEEFLLDGDVSWCDNYTASYDVAGEEVCVPPDNSFEMVNTTVTFSALTEEQIPLCGLKGYSSGAYLTCDGYLPELFRIEESRRDGVITSIATLYHTSVTANSNGEAVIQCTKTVHTVTQDINTEETIGTDSAVYGPYTLYEVDMDMNYGLLFLNAGGECPTTGWSFEAEQCRLPSLWERYEPLVKLPYEENPLDGAYRFVGWTDKEIEGETRAVPNIYAAGSYAEGDTFTVTSAKACVAAISFDGGESYTELPASPTADENTYTFTLPALTGDFVIGIVLLGDANGDGKVNTADGLRIQRYITFDPDDPYESNYELTALTELAADANGDGKVNTADVLRIQRHITFDPDDPYESNYELCWNVAS